MNSKRSEREGKGKSAKRNVVPGGMLSKEKFLRTSSCSGERIRGELNRQRNVEKEIGKQLQEGVREKVAGRRKAGTS